MNVTWVTLLACDRKRAQTRAWLRFLFEFTCLTKPGSHMENVLCTLLISTRENSCSRQMANKTVDAQINFETRTQRTPSYSQPLSR